MKRKGLKILCGVLATLCIVGATSTVVGALSDGFKNWDTSTWFDKGTSEPVTKEDLVTTPDDTQPVKMSVRYLSDNSSVKRVNDVKPMTGLVITASLDSQYGECNKFEFSFSSSDTNLFNYSVTDNTCTINFLKKSDKTFSLTAITKEGSTRYKGKINIDFLCNTMTSVFPALSLGCLNTVNSGIFFDPSASYNVDSKVRFNLFSHYSGSVYDNVTSITFDIVDSKLNSFNKNLFSFSNKSLISGNVDFNFIGTKEDFDNILADEYFKNKEGYIEFASLTFTVNFEHSEPVTYSGIRFLSKGYTIVNGGVDMGGDIVVG